MLPSIACCIPSTDWTTNDHSLTMYFDGRTGKAQQSLRTWDLVDNYVASCRFPLSPQSKRVTMPSDFLYLMRKWMQLMYSSKTSTPSSKSRPRSKHSQPNELALLSSYSWGLCWALAATIVTLVLKWATQSNQMEEKVGPIKMCYWNGWLAVFSARPG